MLSRSGREVKPFGAVAVGLVVLYLLVVIPVVGPVVKLLTLLLGLGALVTVVWERRRAVA